MCCAVQDAPCTLVRRPGDPAIPAALHRHLSPITIGVNISILGLSLYNSGWPAMGACIQLGLPVVVLIIVFGFHLRRVQFCGCVWRRVHAWLSS